MQQGSIFTAYKRMFNVFQGRVQELNNLDISASERRERVEAMIAKINDALEKLEEELRNE